MAKALWWLLAATALTVPACGDDGGSGDDDDDIDASSPDGATGEPLECEVAIIGGGAGGVHTAYRLAPDLGEGVCLFEKEAFLGGRLKDVPANGGTPNDPTNPLMGVGGRRIQETQENMLALADELGVTLEQPALVADLIESRGAFGTSREELLPLYPGVTPDDSGDTETAFYEALMGPAYANATDYPDFRSFVRGELGVEEFEFLRDMSRFRADFEYPLDARGYMDYFLQEWDVYGTPYYPVGGMSELIRRMVASIEDGGGRIFLEEPVSDISRAGTGYRLTTATYSVTAEKVVIAAPPNAFDWITGDVADDIKAQSQYQDLIGVKVATVTQWYETSWWEEITVPAGKGSDNIWRAWTTDQCFNFLEIPLNPYAADQHAIRTVYDDHLPCVLFWEDTYAQGGVAAVEAEIKRELEWFFNGNGVTSPATFTIPDPVSTYVQIWEAGWWWLRAGTSHTNDDIFAWAIEPLSGEDVALVGEAYNPNRSGWSDAAVKSSINLLNQKYGFELPGLDSARLPAPSAPRSTSRGR